MGTALLCRTKHTTEITPPNRKHYSQITSITAENIRNVYSFGKVIGKGSYGVVREGNLLTDPSTKLAIKILEKDSIKNKIYILEREVMILQKLDHPNIIKFYETYQDNKYLYIVMEYCGGGELLDRIIQKKHLAESETCDIMLKILSALNYIHKKKVVHRDIKPENILFSDSSPNSELKIIDFGLSNIVKSDFKENLEVSVSLHTRVGTPHYVAPEVIQGNYTQACDIWSLGVMMYLLLSGNPPFISDTEVGLFKKIEKGFLTFEGKEWSKVSMHAKDLILRMIKVNPKKRITSEQALKHPWFQKKKINGNQVGTEAPQDPNSATHVDKNILNMLRNRKFTNKLKKEILKVVVNQLNSREIMNLSRAFQELDQEHQGIINSKELMEVMKINGFVESETEISTIIHNITGDREEESSSLVLNYTDFITATLDLKQHFDKQKLWNLFKYFDVRNNEYITVEDLKDVMARGGKKIPVNELHQIIKENNLAKDGRISFDDFCKMLDIDQVNEFQPVSLPERSKSLLN